MSYQVYLILTSHPLVNHHMPSYSYDFLCILLFQTTTSKTRAVGRASVNQGRSDEFSSIRWSVAWSSLLNNLRIYYILIYFVQWCSMFVRMIFWGLQCSLIFNTATLVPCWWNFNAQFPASRLRKWRHRPWYRHLQHCEMARFRTRSVRSKSGGYSRLWQKHIIYIYICTDGNRCFPSARSQNVILTFSPSVHYNML